MEGMEQTIRIVTGHGATRISQTATGSTVKSMIIMLSRKRKSSREKAERMEVPIMRRSLIPEIQTEGLAMEAISRMQIEISQKPTMMERIHLIISRRRMCRMISLVKVVEVLGIQEHWSKLVNLIQRQLHWLRE